MSARCHNHKRFTAGCADCQATARADNNHRARMTAYYGPILIPAPPIAAHVRRLLAEGATRSSIARAAGISSSQITHLLAGQARLHRELAERVLTVTSADVAGESVYVPNQPVVLRLRHLSWMGWSQSAIAEGTGMSQQRVSMLTAGQFEHVTRTTADAVFRFFRAHWQVDGGSERARRFARRQGWQSIMAADERSAA